MQDYEKLGVFYLGKNYNLAQGKRNEDLVLYDSKDLTTHALIIGMTGSGKTGLGLSLLEEAAIDNIPVIAVDPKGDLGNLLLTFPQLQATDFKPWLDPQSAMNQGVDLDTYASQISETWRDGLKEWGQESERIQRLRDAADFAIYTPGSNAGIPISVLGSFSAPSAELREDSELYHERIHATATSLLALLKIDADPVSSREHILLSNILAHSWDQSLDLDLAGLIAAIQTPAFDRVGVLALDTFFPANERIAFALQINNLLAAPGFAAWMQGVPLDAKQLFYSTTGKARVSVISIAHLGDAERMFFLAMLLNEVLSWMRRQSGTSSLRAILYIDELFGYMPPVANPPSKLLLLTLLKQARAFGLGMVLATQNPVDLDYKGLSNVGTWFIGRLQTERDKARVMEGLEGAAAGREFDHKKMEQTLAGLGKRIFLLHNVHDDAPFVFQTRWTLSFLSGPLTREQIKRLSHEQKSAAEPNIVKQALVNRTQTNTGESLQAPILSPDIKQYFLPLYTSPGEGRIVYQPRLLGMGEITYQNAKLNVSASKRYAYLTDFGEGPVPIDWSQSEESDLEPDELSTSGLTPASFAECPTIANIPKNYTAWQKLLERWLKTNNSLALYRSPTTKLISEPDESLADFRIRLQQISHEQRDLHKENLRAKFAPKLTSLNEKLRRAEQLAEKEAVQSTSQKLDLALSIGSSLLGAFMGRKALSATNMSKIGSAVKGAGRLMKEKDDLERATESVEGIKSQITALEQQFTDELATLEGALSGQTEYLEEILIKPKVTDIHVDLIALVWVPSVV